MLRHLTVRNLAVLEEASLDLESGFGVVTGETGAGKSLVVDSLALLAGARANAAMIRTGADKLVVTGIFEPTGVGWREPLESAGVPCDEDELVVRREVARSGRNRVFLNDQPVTLRLLSEVAGHLIRIFGQSEEAQLLDPDLQRSWLDRRGGSQAHGLLADCRRHWEELSAAKSKLERVAGNERIRLERLDLLRYQLQEIDQAAVESGEEQKLRHERDRLRHHEEIATAMGLALALLCEEEDAADVRIARSRLALEEVASFESAGAEWLEELQELEVRSRELGSTLRSHLDRLEPDPARLEQIEERLTLLERLFRKYGATTAEVLTYRAGIEDELFELDADEETLTRLQTEVDTRLLRYQKTAARLSASRQEWAVELCADLAQQLSELHLADSRFEVLVEPTRSGSSERALDAFALGGPNGADRVSFQFSPNPGEDLKPLAQVASGGELARVYLGLQLLLAKQEADHAVLVFDEVDSGLGGHQASVVGHKLQSLAASAQVLAVTHLPQVASYGDQHFRVTKTVRDERTFVAVGPLDGEQRIEEVARMLAGSTVTELSRSHAVELLESSQRTADAEVH